MGALNLSTTLLLSILVLALHLVSVTLTKALRAYSPSRLEARCAARKRPERAADVAHFDQRTERSAEVLAVSTGLALAAFLGVLVGHVAPNLAVELVVAIALLVGAVGYVLAGVIGRVFAETVIDHLWPAARTLRAMTAPLTFGLRQVETLAFKLGDSKDASPRPTSVEVEIPSDGEDPKDDEAELPESTLAMIQNAIEFNRRDVSEIMTPRSAIVALPASVSALSAALTFSETGKSRIPLFGENHDDIVGILYVKDLFPRMIKDGGADVLPRKLVRPAYCVPETKSAFELMEEFRSRQTQVAIVLDEYGGVAGLVTLEDLLEELVGEIDDEHDVPERADTVISLPDGQFDVDATLALEDVNERLHLHLPTDGDFLTVGGLAFHALGRLPEPGATFRQNGVEFTVLEVADHSIRRVRLDLRPAASIASPAQR